MADTITTTGTSTTGYTAQCGHYLPCGYCAIMKSICPMFGYLSTPRDTTPVPTWKMNEVTGGYHAGRGADIDLEAKDDG